MADTGGAADVEAAALGFLHDVVTTARTRFGVTSDQLATFLRSRTARLEHGSPVTSVVQCSEFQSRDLAAQVAETFAVDVQWWWLADRGEPPPGPLLATDFHLEGLRKARRSSEAADGRARESLACRPVRAAVSGRGRRCGPW